jgi:hypothetical protein
MSSSIANSTVKIDVEEFGGLRNDEKKGLVD